MNVTEAHVRFVRQCSDGNYGWETVSVDMDIALEDGDQSITEEDLAAALHACRLHVEDELAKSPNWSVQRGVEYPKPRGERLPGEAKELEDLPF